MVADNLPAFTGNHRLGSNGEVAFECSQDHALWPWLALPHSDPIVVQSINYWASVETAHTRGTYDRTKWSALTYCRWHKGEAGAGPIHSGRSIRPAGEDALGYQLDLFDQSGASVFNIRGQGVVFQNRNFESWREDRKRAVAIDQQLANFEFCTDASVGLSDGRGVSFIAPLKAPLQQSSPAVTTGLVSKENGLPPASPYLSGSGDHVNATHLAEVGRQGVCLAEQNPLVEIVGGEIRFLHFVELGHSFRLEIEAAQEPQNTTLLNVFQFDRHCAQMRLTRG